MSFCRTRCPGCPYKESPVVPGSGTPGSLVLIGEAPGEQEIKAKKPFVGRSGTLLRGILKGYEVDPHEIYIMNAVPCRNPQGKNPTTKEVLGCREGFLEELREARPKKILALGGVALGALFGGTKTPSVNEYQGVGFWFEGLGYPVYTVATRHPAAVLRDFDLGRDLMESLGKLLTHDRPVDPPGLEVEIASTLGEVQTRLRDFSRASVIGCDFETTGVHPYRDIPLSLGFAVRKKDPGKGRALIIPPWLLYTPGMKELLQTFFLGYDGRVVFHNSKFDLQFLEKLFGGTFGFPRNLSDTMMMNYVLDERPFAIYGAHSLKSLTRRRYDFMYKFPFEPWYQKIGEAYGRPFTWDHPPEPLEGTEKLWNELFQYQALDCYWTTRLYFDLKKEILEEDPKLLEVADGLLTQGQRAFGSIELHGTLIDRDYFRDLTSSVQAQVDQATRELQRLAEEAGFEKNLNPSSASQIKVVLQRHFGLPVQSTARADLQLIQHTLDPQAPVSRFLKVLLQNRQDSKVLSTYLGGLLERVDTDGRIRPDFRLHGTATGRLSCSDPNLQNIPTLMGPEIRMGFIAPEGWNLLEVDYSQLELRVAALLSGDENLITTFREGRDIHRAVAAKAFRISEAEVTHHLRYIAKYIDFGALYGRGPQSLTEGWEVEEFIRMGGKRWTLEEARTIINDFMDGFPGLKEFIKSQQLKVTTQGYVDTPIGRRRRFPLMVNSEVPSFQRQAVNTPIQSLASDICLSALIRLHDLFSSDPQFLGSAYVLFSVHDAIYVECREEITDLVLSTIKEIMSQVPVPNPYGVPFKVEATVSKRWGEGK